MEIEYNNSRSTYIHMLVEVLQKKSLVLSELLTLTEQQEQIINQDNFDDDRFLETVNSKEKYITDLLKLDQGFEQLYERVREELTVDKALYKNEIEALKAAITFHTNTSVKIQALEQRNKTKIEVIFSNKRMNIRNSRMSSQSVATYYKTAAKQQEVQSIFYDKKK